MEAGMERIVPLAEDVLSIARAQLLVHQRFLDRALCELRPAPQALVPLATDGKFMFYEPVGLLQAYRREQGHAVRVWAHMLMHCLFRHMFIGGLVDERLWDLASDMASEAVLLGLNIRQLQGLSGRVTRQEALEELRASVRTLTAEQIYHHLMENRPREAELKKLEEAFALDDHTLWHSYGLRVQLRNLAMDVGGNEDGQRREEPGSGDEGAQGSDPDGLSPSLSSLWKDISGKLQTALETFARQQGAEPGSMLQSLRSVNRERCDYRQFLRKFASRTEVMRLSPDEYDYVYYTYGMTLYRDMPLIEPLEYREDRRIRDFVIAIDTSGSVAGEQVQKFLQKTFTVLKQEETFDRRFNLHIIQCDAEVQEDVQISTQEEFDRYIRTMQIRGLGGTDFRPVFERVEQLRREKRFRNLKGLIYFTDGCGVFPAKPPDYLTAFVFVDDEAKEIAVPPWAIRMVMETGELAQ